MAGRYHPRTIVATGYGRHLFKSRVDCKVVTEIKAHALGASFFFPNCRIVIDIGEQDSKVIRCKGGIVEDFTMNDRCAAGTGRFLEVMASTLECSLEEFGRIAASAKKSVAINSMCTVFAESEVISLIARGEDSQAIALGLHESIVNRLSSQLGKIGIENDVVFSGGVAKNLCIKRLIERRFGIELKIPPEPQIIGALGAALIG